MRWVILTDDFGPMPSGVATWTAAAADALADAGDDVAVFARRRTDFGASESYRVRGVGGPSFGRFGGAWTALAAHSAIRRADAVLASTWPVAIHAVAMRRRPGAPFHVVFHGSDITRPPIHPRGLARVLRRATHRWAVSRFLADLVEPDCGVLPAPVDIAMTTAEPGGRWGMVARATPLKGGERFVNIVAAAGARGLIVGDGPALPRWKQAADRVGADIRFTGALSHKQTLAHIAGLEVMLLLPRTHDDGSGAEGAGLVLLEAASLGIACVGCRVGGVPEALGPGLLLADPDDATASAEQIRVWLSADRGRNARAWLAANHGKARLADALRDS